MSDILDAVVLGIVQGLTEFLPVSSTGHLVVTEKALGLSKDEFGLRFDAAIHLGTLAAVLAYFWPTLVALLRSWLDSLAARRWDLTPPSRLAWLLIIGTIPAGLAGLALESTAEDKLRSTELVAAMLILFTLPLYLAERYGGKDKGLADAGPAAAVGIGVAQAVALVPGVSRSGITISAGMVGGFRRRDAAEFAFLLSAPIVAAAGGKQLLDIATGASDSGSGSLGVYLAGLVTAGVIGYAAIAFLMRYLRFNSLTPFIIYRVLAGVVLLVLAGAGLL